MYLFFNTQSQSSLNLIFNRFGQSIGGHLAIANIAWPNEWTILIGSFSAALGAGMQSLTGAPRLLQAIAKDRIIPVLEPFGVSSGRGEPTRALLFTLCICEFGVLLGKISDNNMCICLQASCF